MTINSKKLMVATQILWIRKYIVQTAVTLKKVISPISFWATWLITKSCFSQIYICDKYNQYVATIKNGDGCLYYINISEDDVDRYIKDSFTLG